MTFLEALYGSQYNEIHKQGKDGNKGRRNANILLAAFIIVFLFAVTLLAIKFLPGFETSLNRSIKNVFGKISGRSAGKLMAIPLMAIIYFIVAFTVGSQKSFTDKVEKFMQYPDEIKKQANKKILLPFFILLALVLILALSSLK